MGWARANLLYELTAAPPEPGTIMESLLLLVWRARQEIRFQETRSVVQAVLAASVGEGGEKEASEQLEKSWEQYLDEMYPYQRGTRKRADDSAMEVLLSEASKGPLVVTPLVPLTKGKSKLRKQQMASGELRAPKYRKRRRGR